MKKLIFSILGTAIITATVFIVAKFIAQQDQSLSNSSTLSTPSAQSGKQSVTNATSTGPAPSAKTKNS